MFFRPECHEHYKAITLNSRLNLLLYQYPLDHEVSDGWLELDPRPDFPLMDFNIDGVMYLLTWISQI
jgi:hypothetical protein